MLAAAPSACGRADLTRAAKQLGIWRDGGISLDAAQAADMAVDLALFEPNRRGRRVFDRFLAERAPTVFEAADLDLARRMASTFFSAFRIAGRHEVAGLWLEDLLDGDRRLWLMDEGLTESAPDGLLLGMRLMDAGPFHAGFGIVVPADAELVDDCAEALARGSRLPVRHSLAATLYRDAILDELGPPEELVEALLDLLPPDLDDLPEPAAPPSRPTRRGKPRRTR